jgi:hypothetical protein
MTVNTTGAPAPESSSDSTRATEAKTASLKAKSFGAGPDNYGAPVGYRVFDAVCDLFDMSAMLRATRDRTFALSEDLQVTTDAADELVRLQEMCLAMLGRALDALANAGSEIESAVLVRDPTAVDGAAE